MDEPRPALLALGALTAVAQAVLLREAMAAFGGSELAWGAVMAVWLAAIAIGARLAPRLAPRLPARPLLPAIAVAAAGGAILLRAAPVLESASAGELTSVARSAWWWGLAVAPAAVLGGACFPLLVVDREDAPARAYALEALGGTAGGVALALVLGPGSTASALVLALAGATAFALWPVRHGLAVVSAALIAATIVPASDALAELTWRWSRRPGDLGAWAETRHQRLERSAGLPSSIYADGRLVATWPDPYLVVPTTHLRMLLHPRPRHVALVGGLLDGGLETVLRHPVERVDVVATDPAVPRLTRRWFGGALARALDAPAVRLHSDPIAAVERLSGVDLLILGGAGPPSLRAARVNTVEFYRSCRAALSPGGVLVLELPLADTYLGGVAGELLATTAATLGAVFPQLTALPGERITLVATADPSAVAVTPGILGARWQERRVSDPGFDPALLPVLLDPARQRELAATVASLDARPATRDRPRTLLLATALDQGLRGHAATATWLRRLAGAPRWPAGLAVLLVAAGIAATARFVTPLRAAPAVAIGAASLGWWLLLVSAWQSTVGTAYSQIGALTGVFMAGLAAAAWTAGRGRDTRRRLRTTLLAGAAVSLAIASGVATAAPRVMVPILLLAAGAVTGRGFPDAARLTAPRDPRRAASRGFAADEAGAAIAAALVGTVAVPWAGTTSTAVALLVVCLAALPAAGAVTRPEPPRSRAR